MKNLITLTLAALLVGLVTTANASTLTTNTAVKAETYNTTVTTTIATVTAHPPVWEKVLTLGIIHNKVVSTNATAVTNTVVAVSKPVVETKPATHGFIYGTLTLAERIAYWLFFVFAAFITYILIKNRTATEAGIKLDWAEAKALYQSLLSQTLATEKAGVATASPILNSVESKLKVAFVDVEDWIEEVWAKIHPAGATIPITVVPSTPAPVTIKTPATPAPAAPPVVGSIN
jgi:hypothetical protein